MKLGSDAGGGGGYGDGGGSGKARAGWGPRVDAIVPHPHGDDVVMGLQVWGELILVGSVPARRGLVNY